MFRVLFESAFTRMISNLKVPGMLFMFSVLVQAMECIYLFPVYTSVKCEN